MMQMLAAGGLPILTDNNRKPDIDNPRGYLEFEAVKRTRQDPAWLTQAQGKAVKIVHVQLLNLPRSFQYRIIFMKRQIGEVLASQRIMLKRAGKPMAALPDSRLAAIYLEQLNTVRSYISDRPEFQMLEIDYLLCVMQPAIVATDVNQFLGGCLEESQMSKAVAPSLYRNRADG